MQTTTTTTTAEKSKSGKGIKEFDCPACNANNPTEEPISDGAGGALQLLRQRVPGDASPTRAGCKFKEL